MNKFHIVLLGKMAIAHLAILQRFLTFFPPRKRVNICKDAPHGPTKSVNLVIISKITVLLKKIYVNIWRDVFHGRITNALVVIIINIMGLLQSTPAFIWKDAFHGKIINAIYVTIINNMDSAQ